MTCLFCRIVKGDLSATIVYQDEEIVAFVDNQPAAPVHLLIIPRRHIATLNDLTPHEKNLMGHMLTTATYLAQTQQLAERGYRLVINCNADAGQSVFHIHLHLLGGRAMGWPPFTPR